MSSESAVEREKGTLKTKLTKCCEETGLHWKKVHPIVLICMRMRRRARANLSPFEILFVRRPHWGIGQPADRTLPDTH